MKLDPHTFGKSRSAEMLADEFNRANDPHLLKRFSRAYTQYCTGSPNIVFMRGSTRQSVLEMWHRRYFHIINQTYAKEFSAKGITLTLVHNLLKGRWKQAIIDGDVIERLNQ